VPDSSNVPQHSVRELLTSQFEISWSLTSFHLNGLTTEECLWRPAVRCLHVSKDETGRWSAEWPEHERYEIGPPSIAWTTWHICFWWRKTLDHLLNDPSLSHQDVFWPGSAHDVCAEIERLRDRWLRTLAALDDSDLQIPNALSWPIPFSTPATIAAWLNVELMKNAAEIGVVRFLFATRNASTHTL
jgi:hypothetical protein